MMTRKTDNMMRGLIVLLLLNSFMLIGQESAANKKRLNWVRYGGLATYTVGMIGLNEVWYSQSPRSSFHFFNDGPEWKQMDKAGHVFSAFQLNSITYQTLKWAGSNERKRAMTSALIGLGLMSSIEIFDGFSSEYGASVFDIAANTTGCLLFWGQMKGWNEIRIYPKYSFHKSGLASKDTLNLLGKSLVEQSIKDYNGQTIWLSVDVDKFIRFPKWLNIAVGYGAQNMVRARDSKSIDAGYNPYRQFYLGFDIDATAIKTKSKLLKSLIYFVNMVKLPAPTLEFSHGKVRGHWLYF